MFVAENSGIRAEDLEKLFYNGFDNPESFSMLSEEELIALGVEEEPIDLLNKVLATMEVYRYNIKTNNRAGIQEQQQIQDEYKER